MGSNAVLEQQVALMHFLACISVIRKAMLCEERQMTYHEHDCCCYLTFDAGLLFAVSLFLPLPPQALALLRAVVASLFRGPPSPLVGSSQR